VSGRPGWSSPSLCASTAPPRSSTRCLTSASPRAPPPARRVRLESCWPKRSRCGARTTAKRKLDSVLCGRNGRCRDAADSTSPTATPRCVQLIAGRRQHDATRRVDESRCWPARRRLSKCRVDSRRLISATVRLGSSYPP
jgi:hypothetical protein